MAEMMDPVTMMQENQSIAADVDSTRENIAMQMTPEGDFSKKAMNQLIRSLNRARDLFAAPPIPQAAADSEVMTEDVVSTLMMLKQASEDAGTELPVSFTGVVDDQDLAVLTAQVEGLVEDRMFKQFLNQQAPGTEEVAEEVTEEVAVQEAEMADTDMDALMMERL
jgi:hypothetical protein